MVFVPFDGDGVATAGIVLEAAFGVDPDTDSSEWTWTDLTSYVQHREGIALTHGRANRTNVADPSEITFTLKNLNGEFTNPAGAYGDQMVRNLPFRVRLNGFGVDVGGYGYHRGTAFLASMQPRWDESTNYSVVDVVAQGRLRRLQLRDDVLKSAAYTAIQRMSSTSGFAAPVAHWPFEDESSATSAASAVSGVDPATTANVTFAASSVVTGAAALATISATSSISATVPDYAPTDTWTVMFACMVPSEPTVEFGLLGWYTSGSAGIWQVTVAPGAPSAIHLRAYTALGASILDASTSLDEASFYGSPRFITATATQSGTGISYAITIYAPDGTGGGTGGTLASNTAGNVARFNLSPQAGTVSGTVLGHIALHVQPGADGDFSTDAILAANSGDFPWARFQRLCEEQNIPYDLDSSDNTDLEMGPQSVATFMSLVREAELVEGCVLNDSGEFSGETGLLWFPARDDRENIGATLTLDVSAGQVAMPFEPILDDQDIVNDFEASRSTGSSARVRDEVSIATEGIVRGGLAFNLADDTFLPHLAGRAVNYGTVKGMRFPSVTWNLRNHPELVEDWMACRLFNRIDITNPPSQYPPDDIQAILEGYTEVLSADRWMVRANLSPYQPNKIFLVASDTADSGEYVGRLAGDENAAIRTAITSSGTSIDIDPNRCRWATLLIKDTFTRTVGSSWGSPDLGIAWALDVGTAADFSVNGSVGVMSHPTAGVNHSQIIFTGPDSDSVIHFNLPVAPVGGGGTVIVVVRPRWTDANNHYEVRATVSTGGSMTTEMRKRVAGSPTSLASGPNFTLSTSAWYALRISTIGTTIRAKIWDTSGTEPDWQLAVTDTSLTTGNFISVLSVTTSITNLPYTVNFDNFAVSGAYGQPDDFNPEPTVRFGGETATVEGVSTTAVTYVAAGAASHADNAAVTPAIYAGSAANDGIFLVGRIRGTAGSLATPTGYTLLKQVGNLYLWMKVHSGSESSPSVTPSGGSSGDTVSAFTFGFRGTPCSLADLTDCIVDSVSVSNASAANITYYGIYPWQQGGCLLLVIGGKSDDWTSAAITGWTEIAEPTTTTGNDQSLYAAYQIQTQPAVANEGSIAVTGGASAVSESMTLAIAAGYQTLTISSRSTNGVTKAHAAGTKITVESAYVMGM